MHTPPGRAVRLLQQIHDLAQQQHHALADKRLNHFETLLENRQELVTALSEGVLGLDQADETSGKYPDNVLVFPAELLASGDSDELADLVEDVLAIDRQNEVLLRAEMEDLSLRLRQLQRGRQANQGYLTTTPARHHLDSAA